MGEREESIRERVSETKRKSERGGGGGQREEERHTDRGTKQTNKQATTTTTRTATTTTMSTRPAKAGRAGGRAGSQANRQASGQRTINQSHPLRMLRPDNLPNTRPNSTCFADPIVQWAAGFQSAAAKSVDTFALAIAGCHC
jgi:hypothetical protein